LTRQIYYNCTGYVVAMLGEAALRTYGRLPNTLQHVVKRVYRKTALPFDSLDHLTFVELFFDSTAEFERYRTEFETSVVEELKTGYERHSAATDDEVGYASINNMAASRYYALVRARKPETIVETGVCNGVSTLCFLAALARNDSGHLYSIDYPDHPNVPDDESPGWLVPDRYRARWDLRLGLSQRQLPPLLADLEVIDIFAHDSDPSYPCRLFELESVWTYLHEGGVVLCDDIYENGSFEDFAAARPADSGLVAPGVGYLQKTEQRVPIDWAGDRELEQTE
jgi:predicted O-methyltransferase YrrM